jgi:heptosyltransferase-3
MLVKGKQIIRKDIKNILLIQLGDIGDVVLSFSCIRALKENFPESNIAVAVREKAKELIEDCPWTSRVISISEEKRRFGKEIIYQKIFFSHLRKLNFDLAVDLRTGTRGAILALLSRARQRVGFYSMDGKLWRNRIFTHLAYLEGKPGQHMAEYYLNLLITYGLKTDHIWPEIKVPFKKLQIAEELFRKEDIPLDQPIVAIQPFSLWTYKEWGVDKYVDLIGRINDEYDVSIIITGTLNERNRADEITNSFGKNVHNFAGNTTIGGLAAVLKLCKLFIGGDSAGIHISSAVGTPTVSIFGSASSVVWAPRGAQNKVVHKNLTCVPCDLKGCRGDGVSRCLDELTVDEVLPIVKRQIERILDK